MSSPDAPERPLLDFPCEFPIKVLGENVAGFVAAVSAVALEHDAGFDASTIELRPSKGERYLGVTLIVTATDREQLDNLYRALSSHPMVKVVL